MAVCGLRTGHAFTATCSSWLGLRLQLPARAVKAPAPAATRRCRGERWGLAEASADSGGGADASGSDLSLPLPKPRSELEPSYWLSREATVEAQLKVRGLGAGAICRHARYREAGHTADGGSLAPCSPSPCSQALSQNNVPHIDHGIEALYRFTNFDPFAR